MLARPLDFDGHAYYSVLRLVAAAYNEPGTLPESLPVCVFRVIVALAPMPKAHTRERSNAKRSNAATTLCIGPWPRPCQRRGGSWLAASQALHEHVSFFGYLVVQAPYDPWLRGCHEDAIKTVHANEHSYHYRHAIPHKHRTVGHTRMLSADCRPGWAFIPQVALHTLFESHLASALTAIVVRVPNLSIAFFCATMPS